MGEALQFSDRGQFREWLRAHCRSDAGVWLLFGKTGGPKTLRAAEALEEALCFGWIDGQLRSIDAVSYKKYFSQRREDSKWSEKNKALAQSLEERGLLLEGREPACANFKAMPLSLKKTYTRAYFDAKTDAGREKRIAWMTDRLNRNLRPM